MRAWPIIPGRPACPRFVVEDPAGESTAAVLAAPFGEERPLPNVQPLLAVPTVVVAASEVERLRAQLARNRDADTDRRRGALILRRARSFCSSLRT